MSSRIQPLMVSLAVALLWEPTAAAQPSDPYAPELPSKAPTAELPSKASTAELPSKAPTAELPSKAPTAPRAHPAATDTPPPATLPEVEQARARAAQALARAAKSRVLAACLRPAATQVDLAARMLDAARRPEQRAKREAQLESALATMRKCYDPLFDSEERSTERCGAGLFEGDGPGEATCSGPPSARHASLRARTGFGQIRVAQGIPDAASIGAALRDRIGALQSCHDQAVARSGPVRGEMDIGLLLPAAATKATPYGVALRNVTVGDRPMHRCIASALMGTAFPTTAHGALVDLRLLLATETGPGSRAPSARP